MPLNTPEQSYLFDIYLDFQKSLCNDNFTTAQYALDLMQDFLTNKCEQYERNNEKNTDRLK